MGKDGAKEFFFFWRREAVVEVGEQANKRTGEGAGITKEPGRNMDLTGEWMGWKPRLPGSLLGLGLVLGLWKKHYAVHTTYLVGACDNRLGYLGDGRLKNLKSRTCGLFV